MIIVIIPDESFKWARSACLGKMRKIGQKQGKVFFCRYAKRKIEDKTKSTQSADLNEWIVTIKNLIS